MFRTNHVRPLILLLTGLFLSACANVVTPTGGPKDETPPEVTEAVPANGNTRFDGKKIEITFDEYITLTNANQELIFSPPLTAKPDVKLKNKTVVIKFKEDLLPNTTYTVSFGNAIKDFREGNLFKDYVYTFSTGDWLDTLAISGKIINADDEKPADGMFVMLYNEDADSLFFQPTRRQPDFVTKTDKEGAFRIGGLPDKCFLLFALKDVNANLYYDMPNEKVAFIDTLVSPNDSLILQLQAFTEVDTNQMLLENKLVEEGLLRFVFRHPADKVRFTFPDELPDTFRMARVWSKEKDTLSCFFTPNVIDSMRVIINYDTLINDTTVYSLKYRETKRQRRGRNDHFLKVFTNLRNKLLMPSMDFMLKFPEPIVEVRPYDTLRFEQVDEYGMQYRLVTFINDTSKYAVNLPDSVFFSVRGKTNDTLSFSFSRAQRNDYGNLFIQVAPPEDCSVVVELLNGQNKVVDHRVVDTLQRLEFLQLAPQKYKLRAILDIDRDGRWSTGNYHRRFLPEPIVPYKEELDLKPGWDIDLDEIWELAR
jgi:hypothetical protein